MLNLQLPRCSYPEIWKPSLHDEKRQRKIIANYFIPCTYMYMYVQDMQRVKTQMTSRAILPNFCVIRYMQKITILCGSDISRCGPIGHAPPKTEFFWQSVNALRDKLKGFVWEGIVNRANMYSAWSPDPIHGRHKVYSYKTVVRYRISCCTSKSRHPRNVAACFCQLIPINATLKILPHGKGSTAMYVCACTMHYKCTQIDSLKLYLCMCAHVKLCRCCPQDLATFRLSLYQMGPWNTISPSQYFMEIR